MTHARALLDARGLIPKKSLGQNFLMDAGVCARIARVACEDAPQRLLEIGAGTGALTIALAELCSNLTAIEIDDHLISLLREREELANVHFVHADALAFDYAAFATAGPWSVAGNLPYNVATPILTRLVEMDNAPETLVVMVQRDVADRFAARPGTPMYGSLSVAVQYSMDVERVFTLGPNAFFPRPKIDSTIVRFRKRAQPVAPVRDIAIFRQVVRAAFAYRRKTLANSLHLALGHSRETITAAIAQSALPPEIRGEQLDIAAFARLADRLAIPSI
ncbi:MAG: 16S rRNA (adenine(1518)-N(6)/adenine(1519)-N(6))-dimethyltransferase RsmA [Vulcanimicrobiaceae bacterium]